MSERASNRIGQGWSGLRASMPPVVRAGSRHGWIVEVCVLVGLIMVVAAALPARFHLMQVSPHPFWLPVIATTLVHGTWPGIGAALLSGMAAWLYGGGVLGAEDDFYDQMFHTFKEPILWVFCAILLGAFRDRIEDERRRLVRERDETLGDLDQVVDHATGLRARIDDLEREIALGQGSARRAFPAARIHDLSRPAQSFRWVCLWRATERGWALVGSDGIGAPQAPEALLDRLVREPRPSDSHGAADRVSAGAGVLLAVPVRDDDADIPALLVAGTHPADRRATVDDLVERAQAAADRLRGTRRRGAGP